MSASAPPVSSSPSFEPEAARRALGRAVRELAPRPSAVLVRRPLVDPRTPETSDLDLLVVADVEDLFPERLVVEGETGRPVRIDLIWLPRGSLEAPAEFARNGLIAHRLLSSELVFAGDPGVAERIARIGREFRDPDIQVERIRGFLDMGFLTVREIGVTRDFPALALFWLHMAHAACLAAILDGAGRLCPNVYTRPIAHLEAAEEESGLALGHDVATALHLDVDPASLVPALRRIHETVSRRFPEPSWPRSMRIMTRHEYRYFLARDELEWRIAAAKEMARRGDGREAVFYLRFWAYALLRVPMVHRRALEGIDVSFVRPSRAVRPELERLCPEIVDDLADVLGGRHLGASDVDRALEHLLRLRERTLHGLRARGLEPKDLRPWEPYRPPGSDRPPPKESSKERAHA